MPFAWSNLAGAVTALGALGTSAFGLVDATKLVRGGVSSSGFCFIRTIIEELTPEDGPVTPLPKANSNVPQAPPAPAPPAPPSAASATNRKNLIATARANWINGLALTDQKSALKALLKLRLSPANAETFAAISNVNPDVLRSVAIKLGSGDPMTQPELDTYGRFDLLLSATLDRAYQAADQRYRNSAKMAAGVVAIILAEMAAFSLRGVAFSAGDSWKLASEAFVAGLLATPLAPIAKDVSTSLATAAKAVQAVRGQ